MIKRLPEEQVRIDDDRIGLTGAPVQAYLFSAVNAQAMWITQKVRQWINEGVKPNEIAIPGAKQWGPAQRDQRPCWSERQVFPPMP